MRILHVTLAFQHPQVRGSDRHYHFLRELSQRHELTLLTLVRSEVPGAARAEVESYAERVVEIDARQREGASRLARELCLRRAVGEMRDVFRRLVEDERFDAVLFHGKSLYRVVAGLKHLPLVVDLCDATSMRTRMRMRYVPRWRVPLLAARYLEVRRVERRLAAATPYLAFISARDREAVLGPGGSAEIVPNGVDAEYWRPRLSEPDGKDAIVFTGVMDYEPNEDAARFLIERVVPALRRARPGIGVAVVGRDPRPELARAAEQAGVEVTGFVEDLRPYLDRATVFAAPLRVASGMQNKVLEAMAVGVPVVTTPVVAGGLRVDGHEPPVVSAALERFTEALLGILADSEMRARMEVEGRLFVEQHFDWARSAGKLERLCELAVEGSPLEGATVAA